VTFAFRSVLWGTAAIALTLAVAATGSLSVRVLDTGGDPLPGAVVTISSADQRVAKTSLVAGPDGIAEFPVLRSGDGYALDISFPGYALRSVPGLRVGSGDHPLIEVRMVPAIEERVEVRASREVVDLGNPSTSTRFSDEFIQELPVQGRFYQNILSLAPGVLDPDGDGNPNVHGARSRSFKALVSGVSNVDPLTGEWLSEVNPESIEEIEVITAGAGAEYGRAQGGFAQIVQKQGSNDFEGVVGMLYSSSRLDGEGSTGTSLGPVPKFEWIQPFVQVSGPIVRDRLWYRLSYESIEREDPVILAGRVAVTTRSQSIQSYQLTWQASPRNKLAFQYQDDPKTLGNVGLSARVPVEATKRQEFGGPTLSLGWVAAQSPRLLVDSLVAYQEGRVSVFPMVPGVPNECLWNPFYPKLDSAQCFFTNANSLDGSHYISSEDRRQRLTVGSKAELYAGRFLGATHRIKVGFAAENERYYRTLEQRSDLTFTVYRSLGPVYGIASYRVPFPETTNARVTGQSFGLYVEDQFRPSARFTGTVGVRIDNEGIDSLGYSFFNPEQEARTFDALLAGGQGPAQIFQNQFTSYQDVPAFREYLTQALGVDVSSPVFNGVTVQSTFWRKRRRADDIRIRNTNLAPRVSLAWDPMGDGKTKLFATAGRYYDKIFLGVPLIELEPATTTFTFRADKVGPTFVARQNRLGTNISTRIVDRDLRTPFQDEWSAGFEREIAPETALKITWIDRRFRDQLQDIDLNHLPFDYGACIPRAPWVRTVDGPDGQLDDCAGGPDGVQDLYIQNPAWGDVLVVGNSNTARYRAAVLEIVRRFYRSWQMEVSYTWSKAVGDAEDFNQLLGNDRTTVEDERGPLLYDQRHVFKLNSIALVGRGVRLGGSIQFESGLPYSVLESGQLPDAVPPPYLGLGQPENRLRLVYPTGARNDHRNPPFWTFNARVAKDMSLGSGVDLSLTMEVFNLLDDDRLRIYDVTDGRTNFERRFGRRWQLGFRLAF